VSVAQPACLIACLLLLVLACFCLFLLAFACFCLLLLAFACLLLSWLFGLLANLVA
jgi:hypothetical protein